MECTQCDREVIEKRTLTQGTHDHSTNMLTTDSNCYCIEFGAREIHDGVKSFVKIYLHKEEKLE